MSQKTTLIEAANACGEACALLARYRAMLSVAANLEAPVVERAIIEIRRTASSLECAAIALASAKREVAA
ncbi:hypothetical protein [Pandoraea sp. NPDC087047]|uniref:hypothetical protein n=1 Tax=Pandoraea sp. NPDC087047 TaxID=3364390 RepID=UPI00382CA637